MMIEMKLWVILHPNSLGNKFNYSSQFRKYGFSFFIPFVYVILFSCFLFLWKLKWYTHSWIFKRVALMKINCIKCILMNHISITYLNNLIPLQRSCFALFKQIFFFYVWCIFYTWWGGCLHLHAFVILSVMFFVFYSVNNMLWYRY